jgi:hypothetical protein
MAPAKLGKVLRPLCGRRVAHALITGTSAALVRDRRSTS